MSAPARSSIRGSISFIMRAPIGVLAQHEFDELGARGEGGEPEAAARRGRQPRRIDRQIVEHGSARFRPARWQSRDGASSR